MGLTGGTSPAMLLAFGAMAVPGEHILLTDPAYGTNDPGLTQIAGYRAVDADTVEFTLTTDIPTATQLLSPRNYMNTGATVAAVAYDCSGVYVETDY